MQIQNIKRPSLISDFFNLEIDYKNDYVEYITTTNHKNVTSLLNTSKKILNKKMCTTYKYAEIKKLSSLFITVKYTSISAEELSKQFQKLFRHASYKRIDKNSKRYFRFIQNNSSYCNL